MSGPKAADVKLKLGKLVDCLRRQAAEATKNAAKYAELGLPEAEVSRQAAHVLRELSQTAETPQMRQFAATETTALAQLTQQMTSELQQGDAAFAAAQTARQNAARLRTEAASHLKRASEMAVEVSALMAQREGQAHGFYAEDKRANEANDVANKATNAEREASLLLQSSVDQLRSARDHFQSAQALGQRVKAESLRVSQLATQRKQVAEIAAEQRRKAQATAVVEEAQSLARQIEQLNHEKFAPGEMAPLRSDLERLKKAFAAADYALVDQLATASLGRLRTVATNVADRQSRWETQRSAAANDLESVRQELQTTSRDDLAQWSGNSVGVRHVFDQLESAQRTQQHEEFAETHRLADEARQAFRQLSARAHENRAKFDQRDVIADAVMNALYEQGYDAPTMYFAQKSDSGKEDCLSDLVIFAKSPGNSGDMRMKVDLDAHVDLEVENIPSGQEGCCVSIIQDLQGRLAGDIDFRMTNWGRAEHHQESAVIVQVQDKVKDKMRERDRG